MTPPLVESEGGRDKCPREGSTVRTIAKLMLVLVLNPKV